MPGSILVRLPNWVGDIMMALPALASLRAGFPHDRLVGMARPQHVELVKRISYLDDVVVAPPRTGAGRPAATWSCLRELRRAGLERAVLLAPSFEAALTVWLAGIPVRVGHDTDHRALLPDACGRGARRTPLRRISRCGARVGGHECVLEQRRGRSRRRRRR